MWVEIISFFKIFISLVATVASVIAIINFVINYSQIFFRYIMKPRIIWGLWDSPYSTTAHYYICVKTWHEDLEQSIKLTLIPHILQQSDYVVGVRFFYQEIGKEHWKIDINEQVVEKNKEINFKLLANVVYRIVIQGSGGRAGTLVCENITLKLKAQDVVIKRKDQKPPLEKYNFLVNLFFYFKR